MTWLPFRTDPSVSVTLFDLIPERLLSSIIYPLKEYCGLS
jgi:hypothetical protein